MSELEKLDALDTGTGYSKWMIVAGIVIAVILVIILSLIYNKITPRKSVVKGTQPMQKTINFLDEAVTSGVDPSRVEIKTIGGTTQGLFINQPNEEKYRAVIAAGRLKPWNRETSQGSVGRGGASEGYENSYNVANVKPRNRETSQGWIDTEGLTPEELAEIAIKGPTDGDEISKGITINEVVFENTPYENDSIAKAALRNARKAVIASKLSSNAATAKRESDAAAAEKAKADTLGAFVAAKGGLMEVDEVIPYIIIDGKKVAAPGIGGLGYYANYQSTKLDGGSFQKSHSGVYNSKSYYGYNPNDRDTDATLPYGNSVFGYRGVPVGSGAVVVDVTGETPLEFEDTGVAGRVSDFQKGDLVGIYEGSGYYSNASLYADGIDISNPIDDIILSGVIAEEAEVEYREELQKAADEEALASTTECDPMLIYNKLIGLVEDGADTTTPLSVR